MENIKSRNGHTLEYYIENLPRLGFLLWILFIIDLYPNCDGPGATLNRWNPLSYILGLLNVIGIFIFSGFSGLHESFIDNRLGFGLSKYFRDNPDLLEFIPRSVYLNK